jgi:hypothetical protein
MSTRTVDNPRRWAAFHSVGTYDLLMEIHASYEDFLGAIRDGRPGVAAHAARALVLRCLAVRALAATGGVPDPEDPLADPFSGLSDETVAKGLGVARHVIRSGKVDAKDAIGTVTEYLREFESELGFSESPPSVRRPEGLFPALRLARELLPLNQAAGIPLALPSGWLPESERSGQGNR